MFADLDPEDDAAETDGGTSSDSAGEENDGNEGREHYVDVG